jgi:hypothetical protein
MNINTGIKFMESNLKTTAVHEYNDLLLSESLSIGSHLAFWESNKVNEAFGG